MTYRFGAFELDEPTGELRLSGRLVKLQQQPFKVLLALVRRTGGIVTREELHALLWEDGTHVEFERGLNFAVNRVREALGDSARAPRFVETLPRRGYRFVAPVEVIGAGAAPPSAPVPLTVPPPRRHVSAGRAVASAACAVVIAAAIHAGLPRDQIDPVALRLTREGQALCGPEGWRRSVRIFAEAAQRAPSLAEAPLGLSRALVRLGEHGVLRPQQAFPQARAAAQESLRRADSAEARLLLATVLLQFDGRPRLAARELDRAEALLQPVSGSAPQWARLARLRSFLGDDHAAIETARRAESLDPGDDDVVVELAGCLQRAGELEEAARVWRAVAGRRPELAHHALFWIQRARGLDAEALDEARQVMLAAGVPREAVAAVARAGPDEGVRMYLRGSIATLTRRGDRELVAPERLALLHAALGDAVGALRCLREAAETRSPMLAGALRDPALRPFRVGT